VKHRQPKKREESSRPEMKHLTSENMDMDELEERIETSLIPFPEAGACGRLFPAQSCSELCGCLSTLCQCDGHDCVGVCDVHCIIHYV